MLVSDFNWGSLRKKHISNWEFSLAVKQPNCKFQYSWTCLSCTRDSSPTLPSPPLGIQDEDLTPDRLQSISGTYTAASERKQRAFSALTRVYSDYLKHSPTQPNPQSAEPRVARNYSPKMVRRNQFEGLLLVWRFVLAGVLVVGLSLDFVAYSSN